MATTDFGVNAPETVKLWSKALAREALKKTYVGKFIGKSGDSLVQEKTETKKDAGDRISITLRMQLTGDGVTEGQVQEGNEEKITTYVDNLLINELGNAVRDRSKIARQRIPFAVRDEAKAGLADWFADRIDTAFFNQICGNTAVTDLRYTGNNATLAPSANNIIRAGALTTDQAVQADTTKTFTLDLIDKAVALAETATPMLRPIKVNGENKYVAFLHPFQVFNLRTNTATGQWLDIEKAALAGGKTSESPIYTGALGEYNGVILHKAVRVTNGVHGTTGVAQTSTRRAVLCGAQAASIAFGQGHGFEQWEWQEESFDYGREFGVSAMSIIGLKKLQFNAVDFGTIAITTYAVQPS